MIFIDYTRKIPTRVGWWHTFLKKPLDILGLPLYPWTFRTKQSLEISKQKINIPGNSTWSFPLLFWLTTGISTCYFFNAPGSFISSASSQYWKKVAFNFTFNKIISLHVANVFNAIILRLKYPTLAPLYISNIWAAWNMTSTNIVSFIFFSREAATRICYSK